MPAANSTSRLRRLPQLMMFVGLIAWYFGSRALAASAASGLSFRFRLVAGRVLLEACFHLFLLAIGFVVLSMVARQPRPLRELLALPQRRTTGREWLTGVGLGWAMVVTALLPVMLLGRIYAEITASLKEFEAAALALAVLLVTTLTHEIAFRGYPFRCLIGAVGEFLAVTLMVFGAGVSAWHDAWVPGIAVLASMLLTLLLSITWLRTRAVWLAWGLHFALVACGSVMFGLPIGGGAGLTSLVRSTTYGPEWLTGGDFGLAAALFSLVVLVTSLVALYRVTREYAWNYTHAPIVAAGYEVKVAPPASHSAMELQAAKAPGLVQILAATPSTLSTESSSDVRPIPPLPNRQV